MTSTLYDLLQGIPPIGSGGHDEVPSKPTEAEYVFKIFEGVSYIVGASEVLPESRAIHALFLEARSREGIADVSDTPDEVQARADLIRSLYDLQAEAIAAREAEEH